MSIKKIIFKFSSQVKNWCWYSLRIDMLIALLYSMKYSAELTPFLKNFDKKNIRTIYFVTTTWAHSSRHKQQAERSTTVNLKANSTERTRR